MRPVVPQGLSCQLAVADRTGGPLPPSVGLPPVPDLPRPGHNAGSIRTDTQPKQVQDPPQSLRQFTSVALAGGLGCQTSSGYHTPRSGGVGSSGGFDAQGYPVSPGGTSIRPPAYPPPMSPRVAPAPLAVVPRVDESNRQGGFYGGGLGVQGEFQERPEEPAKYINELPKLTQTDLANSAVVCGNWLAQVRQNCRGLSPSADVWFSCVEASATAGYNQWLVADPLGRLGLDPSAIVAPFDGVKFQRVESRAVSLLLAALPQPGKDDIIMNRWLSSAAILFRVMCLYQPGGSSERALLLSQLVQPEPYKTFRDAISGLRKWQQNLVRAQEIRATLPDASLLLRGVDAATASLLGSHPMIGFRVNSFRHRIGLDYNPAVGGVTQLVRLLQAESEAIALVENSGEKRARTAAASAKDPPVPKSAPEVPPPQVQTGPSVAVAQVGSGDMKGKDKGKGKGKGGDAQMPLCHKFSDASGCRYGDNCMFKHDRAKAKKEGRCLACGKEGHFRPNCDVVAPENRRVQGDSDSSGASPKAGISEGDKGKGKGAKAKVSSQAKGVTEDANQPTIAKASPQGGGSASQEALLAEAAKLLKGVSIKAVRISEGSGVDASWLRSVIESASDSNFALIDSGATNALRPATTEELRTCRVIRVDLASGATDLRVNEHGTLLHDGHCQVVIPAGYLIEMGYAIQWRRKGCRVSHPSRGSLEVSLVKGCPLVPREVGLEILREYELMKEKGGTLKKTRSLEVPLQVSPERAREWLRDRLTSLNGSGLSEADQFTYLRSVFPEVPVHLLSRVTVAPRSEEVDQWVDFPWNRRLRRSVARASPGSVLLNFSPRQPGWKGLGRVIPVSNSEKGLGSSRVLQQLLEWATSGVIGGIVRSAEDFRELHSGNFKGDSNSSLGWDFSGLSEEDRRAYEDLSVREFRVFLVYAVAQASRDSFDEAGSQVTGVEDLESGTSFPVTSDPSEIALWAMRKAAAKMKEHHRRAHPGRIKTPVFFAFEHLRDMRVKHEKGTRFFWGPKEVATIVRVYGLQVAEFDQGYFGGDGIGETRLVTSSWFLFEHLHVRRVQGRIRDFLDGLDALRELGLRESSGSWAPGFRQAVQCFWAQWRAGHGKSAEIAERKLLLRKLSQAEAKLQHERNDHVPYMKGCPVCIASQARQRSHWRASVTSLYSLSCDLAGPFKEGQGFDPVASGRDRGRNYKYLLVAAYSVALSPTEARFKFGPVAGDTGHVREYAPSDAEVAPLSELHAEQEPGDPEPEGVLFDPAELGPIGGFARAFRRVREKSSPRDDPADIQAPSGPSTEGLLPTVAPPKGSLSLEVDEVAEAEKVTTRTLFIAVPLRSKRGKEVLGQVQAMVNRFECVGFPIHRYFSDRAKELRSHELISWMRDRGVHASFTAGEDPQGNKAELAVKHIKQGIRKLLQATGLPSAFWPLAALHVSARNLRELCIELGKPQPVLLPFGCALHARQRLGSGHKKHWEPRTVPGRYLGQALDCTGGHLVLVGDPSADYKVLLTNTVYPVDPAFGPPKPKFRLVGKRSPGFKVRAVAAAVAGWTRGRAGRSRLSPGGESFEAGFDGELFKNSVDRCDPEDSAENEFKGLFSGSEGIRISELDLGSGSESSDEVVLDLLEPEGHSVNSVGLKEDSAGGRARWLQDKLDNGSYCFPEALDVLRKCAGKLQPPNRKMMGGNGRYAVLGLYNQGGFRGVSRFAKDNELLVRYLNKFVARQGLDHDYTTLYLSYNTCAPMHQDARNEKTVPVWIVALGEFQGGGLWVESEDGAGSVVKVLPSGVTRAGWIYDIHDQTFCFSGLRWHCTEPWCGEDRWSIAAYVPRGAGRVLEDHLVDLKVLGFPVDSLVSESAEDHTSSKFKEARVSLAGAVPNYAFFEPPVGEDEGSEDFEAWEVDFPHEVVSEGWYEGAVEVHSDVAQLCKSLAHELSLVQGGTEALSLSEGLIAAESQREWLEEALIRNQPEQELYGSLKSLKVEVALASPESDGHSDQFLQTRTISLSEARRELNLWKAAACEEVSSLEDSSQAVVRVKAQEVDEWISQGTSVLQLPGKCVLTRKSGTGKRKVRAVGCGNYLPSDQLQFTRDDVYASGADALTLRVALSFAARRPEWKGLTIDIKTAFLNAPIGAEREGRGERIIIKPPSFLVELGILEATDRWWVKKALYGLPTSPRDWSDYRDRELKGFVLEYEGRVYRLDQAKSDESLWFIRATSKNFTGPIDGLVVIYVDDLAVLAVPGLCEAFVNAVQAKWKTSPPSWIGSTPTTFCGIEVALTEQGYCLTQVSYIKELLHRYQVESTMAVPIKKWVEPEASSCLEASLIKQAQGITGALLWLSTRTRPDISFAVSKMGQQATKAPEVSISVGKEVLGYLNSTITMGINYLFEVGPYFSSHGQLAMPRNDSVLEIYSDASHSPGGERSTQAFFIVWRGSPLVWVSTRQAFTTLSTAEAELVSMIHAIQMSEAVLPLTEELLETDMTMSLQGDNAAAVRAFECANSSWRSRHLRMRACAGRERIASGLLKVNHLSGEFQIADLGTKPLNRPRILQLLDLVNIRPAAPPEGSRTSARVLSRISSGTLSLQGLSAETVAGLALLAVVPKVSGQPDYEEISGSIEMLNWFIGFIVCLVGLVWGWWMLYGAQGWSVSDEASFCGSGSFETDVLPVQELLSGGQELQSEGEGSLQGSSGVFHSGNLEEVAEGSSSSQTPRPSVQVGGSSSSQTLTPNLQPGGGILDYEDFAVSSSQTPRPSVQVGGSSSSQTFTPNLQPGGGILDYEDFAYEDSDSEVHFPMVSTGVCCRHFLVYLLSNHGIEILGFLGDRAVEWIWLMLTSESMRAGVICGVIEALRARFQNDALWGPQWYEIGRMYLVKGTVPMSGNLLEDNWQIEEVPVLRFPYVGWVLPGDFQRPVHYLRKVLTWCGGRIVGYLGGRGQEGFALRAVAVSFRQGVIWAVLLWLRTRYTRRCADGPISYAAAEAYFRTGEQRYPFTDSSSEDEAIDERRHVQPQLRVRRVPMYPPSESSSGSSDSGASTTEPSDPSTVDVSGDSEIIGRDPEWTDGPFEESPVAACSYCAGNQGFTVLCGDDQHWVPLEGWSLEEVQTVVEGLTSGDWSSFYALYPIEGGEASDVSGFLGGSVGSPGSLEQGIRRLFLWVLVFLMVPIQVRGEETRMVVYQSFEENWRPPCEDSSALVCPETPDVTMLGGIGYGCWFEVFRIAAAIGIWEFLKFLLRRCQRRKDFKTAASQTQGSGIIPLPLPDGIPHRDRILFCLWRSGFSIDVECYPRKIQDSFNFLVGDWLVRGARNSESSSSGSDSLG